MTRRTQFCTFYIDDFYLGIEVTEVQEVLREQLVTPVPLARGDIRGLINLRGNIVTALDLRTRLRLPTSGKSGSAMNVVLRSEFGSIALLVDAIGDVLEVDEGSREAPPATLEPMLREMVEGVYKLDQRRLLLAISTSQLRA